MPLYDDRHSSDYQAEIDSLKAERDKLLNAITNHKAEVSSLAKGPDFAADIELYQAAGLLPKDYEAPTPEMMKGSYYKARKLLERSLSVMEEIKNINGGKWPARMDDLVTDIKWELTVPFRRVLVMVEFDKVFHYETNPDEKDSKEFTKQVKGILRDLPKMYEDGWKRGQPERIRRGKPGEA